MGAGNKGISGSKYLCTPKNRPLPPLSLCSLCHFSEENETALGVGVVRELLAPTNRQNYLKMLGEFVRSNNRI